MAKALPLLGLGNLKDIADACIYLLNDASRWVTGSNLVVDGGILLGEVFWKQILHKSIINLCFDLSLIAAERFKEQILGGWSLSDGHFLERSNYGYGLAIAGLRLLKGHYQCLYLSLKRCLAMGYGEQSGGGWGGYY